MALEDEHIYMDHDDDIRNAITLCSSMLYTYNYSENQAQGCFCSRPCNPKQSSGTKLILYYFPRFHYNRGSIVLSNLACSDT